MEGWIKLDRGILDWEWWQDSNTTRVWLWLLLNAFFEDGNYRGYDIKRGEVPCNYKQISDSLGITYEQVRHSIRKLQITNQIPTLLPNHKTRHFLIIKINNYEKYQFSQSSSQSSSQSIYKEEYKNSYGGGGHYHSSSPKKKKSVMDDYPDVTM